jgi:uncharacterized protein YqhQ
VFSQPLVSDTSRKMDSCCWSSPRRHIPLLQSLTALPHSKMHPALLRLQMKRTPWEPTEDATPIKMEKNGCLWTEILVTLFNIKYLLFSITLFTMLPYGYQHDEPLARLYHHLRGVNRHQYLHHNRQHD